MSYLVHWCRCFLLHITCSYQCLSKYLVLILVHHNVVYTHVVRYGRFVELSYIYGDSYAFGSIYSYGVFVLFICFEIFHDLLVQGAILLPMSLEKHDMLMAS